MKNLATNVCDISWRPRLQIDYFCDTYHVIYCCFQKELSFLTFYSRMTNCTNKCVWHSLRLFSTIFLGHPNQAVVTSRDNSYYSDHYNVTWSVHSFSKITEYRISYRKAIVSKMDVLNVVINVIMSKYIWITFRYIYNQYNISHLLKNIMWPSNVLGINFQQ